jgi:hypothetical protein
VRASGNASGLTLAVANVAVTYVRPSFDTDANQGGFYVQQSPTGPAIFVRDNTNAANVSAGDVVSFTVTETLLSEGRPEVKTFTGLTTSRTVPVDALAQDFGADAALVTGINDRAAELQRTTVTVTEDVTRIAGGAFRKANATTTALAAGVTLRLAPAVLADAAIRSGCAVTVVAPLGHTNLGADEAQVTAWELQQIVDVASCTAGVATTAVAGNTLTLDMARRVDATTLAGNGSQFAVSQGGMPVAVSAATVDGRRVTLTTAQTLTFGTVTIAATLKDAFGDAFDTAPAAFGAAPPAACPATGGGLFISEVGDTLNAAGKFVELYNSSGSAISLAGHRLRVYSNGGSMPANLNLSGSVPSCSTFVIAGDAGFTTIYPAVAPGQTSGGVNGNGDDVYELFDGTNVLDVFGVVGVDGTGQPWEYVDSIARRNGDVVRGTSTFDIAQWTITDDAGGSGNPGAR